MVFSFSCYYKQPKSSYHEFGRCCHGWPPWARGSCCYGNGWHVSLGGSEYSTWNKNISQTITSRRLGQKKPKECINALNNGFLLASIYSIPISLLGWTYGYLIIPLFITDSITTPIAISYFSISSIGIFFNALSFVFQGFYTGIEKTKVHLSVTITSNIINAYLNAGFIYGKDKIGYLLGNQTNSFFDFSNLWFWADFEGMGTGYQEN